MTLRQILALSALLLPLGCFRAEVQVAEYHVPAMTNTTTEAFILARLKGIPGIDSISADLSTQTLSISYESSVIRTMNIEETIAFSGFDVNHRPANPAAQTNLQKKGLQ